MSNERVKKEPLNLPRKFNHTFKLNEIENDKLKQLRELTGLSVSKIVRDTLFNEQSILSSGHIKDAEELKEFRKTQIELLRYLEYEKSEIQRIGNNLNQIARQLNQRSEFDYKKDIDIIRRQLNDLVGANMEVIEQIWRQPKYIQPEI